MTEQKRGRGRPKKVVAPEVPANPDCEVATKGFVKCIARKLSKHTHTQRSLPLCSILGMGVFGLAFVLQSGSTLIYGVAAAICAFKVIDDWYIVDKNLETLAANISDPSFIQKYEPPTCEPKKECE